jgi:hypothetical protein
MLTQPALATGPAPVDLGSASNFTILAGSAVTATGGGTNTGDIGLSPAAGSFITGLTTNQVHGIIYAVDGSGPAGSVVDPGLLTAAKNDLTTAYTNAAGRPVDSTVATELGGTTRTSGVYDSASGTFGITGILTLDAAGDPDAVFIFKMATTLTTASAGTVALINGAQAKNIFWQVGSSATLGTYSVFKGTIMAQASITMNTGSTIDGRALARTEAVTFDSLAGGLSILSISVSPATWAAGTVATGTVQMSSSSNQLTVANNGNVAETFTLTISDEDDQNEWTHSPSRSGAGNRVYVLSGIFCAGADSPAEGSFNQTDNEDVLTTTEQNATATQFAYAEGTATGVAVPAGAGRSLWLRLDTPTAGAGGIEHKITVRVGCFQP